MRQRTAVGRAFSAWAAAGFTLRAWGDVGWESSGGMVAVEWAMGCRSVGFVGRAIKARGGGR